MKTSLAALPLVGYALANPMPQGVAAPIKPDAPTPAGCADSTSGKFQIAVVNVTSSGAKRGVEKRQLSGTLETTLEGGVLKDQANRTAYIASNFQFQFDSPPQAGAIYTAGFSLCSNNSLALGGSAIFYQCYSGGFYNLYDRHWAAQCSPIYLVAVDRGGNSVTQVPDGQPQGTPIQKSGDGQIVAPTTPIVSQITDGQPQAPTAPPVISQISDGQPQAPTGPAHPIPSGPLISQISDGQPQAPTATANNPPAKHSGPVISQISDGQPQVLHPTLAPTPPSNGTPTISPGPIISQISDGQPQAPVQTGNYTSPNATTSAPPAFTGAAAKTENFGVGAFAVALMGMAALL